MKNRIIKALAVLLIALSIGITAYIVQNNFCNTHVQEHTHHISSDIVDITITTTGNQRVIRISILETGQIATLTQTSRRVARQPTDTVPILPQQTVHHSGNIIKVYSVGSLLIVYELATGVRHYI